MVSASPVDQQKIKVRWSLERLADGNEESQLENAQFLSGIRSTTDNAKALREQGAVPQILALLKARRWSGSASDVPRLLALTLNNIFIRDEAACGQARSSGGPEVIAEALDELTLAALEGSSPAEAASLQLAQALTTAVEVHADSQAAASKSGGVAAAVRLMEGPPKVRRVALELLRELLPALQASQEESGTAVYQVYAQETVAALPQLHTMMAEHSRAFGPGHLPEELLLYEMLSQVVSHTACDEEVLRDILPHLLSCITIFVHTSNGRGKKFPPQGEEALSKCLLAIAGCEKLAAKLRGSQHDFELLRSFQSLLSVPTAVASVRQALAQVQSFVTAL